MPNCLLAASALDSDPSLRVSFDMAYSSRKTSSPFLNLPSELIESILVSATASGCHTSAAAVAQTCRAMRMLVYQPADQHLWRELFCTVFDDPRVFLQVHINSHSRDVHDRSTTTWEDGILDGVQTIEEKIDWGMQFRTRVWARRYLHSMSSMKTPGKPLLVLTQHLTLTKY